MYQLEFNQKKKQNNHEWYKGFITEINFYEILRADWAIYGSLAAPASGCEIRRERVNRNLQGRAETKEDGLKPTFILPSF